MSAKRPELLIETGPLAGRRFTVGDGGLRLGRSSSNDICVPDEELSRNHCLFETSGEKGIRVTDLASANGTLVDGEQIGGDPVDLVPGDVLTLGGTRIRVVGAGEPAPATVITPDVDLGLGEKVGAWAQQSASAASAAPHRRGLFVYFLWAFAVAVLGLALWLLLADPRAVTGDSPVGSVQGLEEDHRVIEFSYEKVSADSEGIFRYQMELSPDGTLKVAIDDVPEANRHVVKSARLSAEALGRIQEIFADSELATLDREYAVPTEDPPKLESCEIKVVFSTRVRFVRVINTPEPDAFRRMRERLETFSKNELGIWAIQYSADKLVELAEASAQTAQTKWADRDVEYGNIHAAIAAWREAMFYLETVNPKPPAYEIYRAAKEMATNELDKRYSEQRFRADRAINLAEWDVAKTELKILCAIIPDREDSRAREAADKLVDVEKRQKNGGAR